MNKFLNNIFYGLREFLDNTTSAIKRIWNTSRAGKLIVVFTGLVILGLSFMVADRAGVQEEISYGKLISVTYVPESTSTHINTNGEGMTMTRTDTDPEHWINVIRYNDENCRLRTSRPTYVGYKGKEVKISYFYGRFTGNFEMLDRNLKDIVFDDTW